MPDATDSLWVGSMPEAYERWLATAVFQPFAVDLASRVAAHQPHAVLEGKQDRGADVTPSSPVAGPMPATTVLMAVATAAGQPAALAAASARSPFVPAIVPGVESVHPVVVVKFIAGHGWSPYY